MFKSLRASWVFSLFIAPLVVALSVVSVSGQRRQSSPAPTSTQGQTDSLKVLQWRSIGPFRGGRSTAVAGVASQPMVFYFGGTGGGVWKTTDGGINWEPITDSSVFGTGSVGAIGLSDSDPNTIYVGMGESPIRGNVSHGDGVYKSTDAGKTWKHIGLEDTRQIARVRVHPRNSDIVYVAALGHVFGPNEQRGVFRSTDGGKTWQKVLYRSNKAGATDLIIDPTNPNIIYAALWEVYRQPWTLESGGPGGGIFKSTDAGDTWTEITRNQGLPKGIVGNIGITVSPVNSDRVWAIVEAEDGGVFRSDNAGKTWSKLNEQRNLRQRAWYYTRIYADPKNAETVYVLNTGFYRSGDSGKTFSAIRVPHGDNHDLWIDPDDPQRMINSNDGGSNVSFNGGATWSSIMNQPTAQFYRVITDDRFPYWVYGAQQDNSTVAIASRGRGRGIDTNDWYAVGGGESGWIAPRPGNAEVVFAGSYGGNITRYDHKAGQQRNVVAWPQLAIGRGGKDLKYRFQWNAPIVISPHDPNTLYHAAQVLLRSRDEVSVRRLPPLPLQDRRLRQDLDEDRQRDPGERLHARHPGGSGAARAYLRRDGAGTLRLFRRRSQLAALPVQSARRADHRPGRQGGGPHRRDAGARLLDPRRPDTRAGIQGRARGRACARLQAAPRRAFPGRRLRRGRGGRISRRYREESRERRARQLLPEGEARREGVPDRRVPRARQGPSLLHEREEGA